MKSRGFEIAISTLILIVVGVLVLIALAYAITVGFSRFGASTKPFTDTGEAIAVREACNIACSGSNKLIYCCKNFSVSNEPVKCFDSRLEIDCPLSCNGFSCAGSGLNTG